MTAPTKTGGLLQNEKDEAAAWYEGLFKGDEEGDEEDKDSKDKSDENDGNDENDEEDEEGDEMTRIAMMRKAYIMEVARRMTWVSP